MDVHNYYAFENCVANIFNAAEYSVAKDVRLEQKEVYIDIVAEKDSKKFGIEVKYSQIREETIMRICMVVGMCNMVPVVVTSYPIEEKRRNYYQEKYPELILIDIANLLFAVQYDIQLRNELISTLPYTVDDIEPQEGFIQITSLRHDDYTSSLIKEMELCEAGRPEARTYEVLCRKLLENIFSEELALWKEQQNSNEGLYRFDLLCRIKDGNQKTFWSILERYFNSKYVIFEFKNHTKQITQKEIYTTEKYLYAKALRSVGILISAHGCDENARWAAKGCLRENGKLIMLLETSDLIKMNKMKAEHDDPSNYLLDKLDELLLELEK